MGVGGGVEVGSIRHYALALPRFACFVQHFPGDQPYYRQRHNSYDAISAKAFLPLALLGLGTLLRLALYTRFFASRFLCGQRLRITGGFRPLPCLLALLALLGLRMLLGGGLFALLRGGLLAVLLALILGAQRVLLWGCLLCLRAERVHNYREGESHFA
jgi:hypothetical protein